MSQHLPAKLPHVGTTIFAVMSRPQPEVGAISPWGRASRIFRSTLSWRTVLHAASRAGHNQYAPMPGLPALLQALADKGGTAFYQSEVPVQPREIAVGRWHPGHLHGHRRRGTCRRRGDKSWTWPTIAYAPAVQLFGGVPGCCVRLAGDMRFDAEAIRKAITPTHPAVGD